MGEQRGPTIKLLCRGCMYFEQERFQVQGDSGYDKYCRAGGERRSLDAPYLEAETPAWCPFHPFEEQREPGGGTWVTQH